MQTWLTRCRVTQLEKVKETSDTEVEEFDVISVISS